MPEPFTMIALLATFGAYLGALIFPAAVVAPLAVKVLTPDLTAAFLRPFWLSYHKFGALGALTLTAVSTLTAVFSALPSIYGVLLFSLGSLMTLCFFVGINLIPKINRAADMQHEALFNSLHRADMALVATALLTGVALIFILGYALAEHPTF
tara:strand:+ start:1080 stop:1538 length:459 start_codon:yes stop_codon:yes gene_type:complete